MSKMAGSVENGGKCQLIPPARPPRRCARPTPTPTPTPPSHQHLEREIPTIYHLLQYYSIVIIVVIIVIGLRCLSLERAFPEYLHLSFNLQSLFQQTIIMCTRRIAIASLMLMVPTLPLVSHAWSPTSGIYGGASFSFTSQANVVVVVWN